MKIVKVSVSTNKASQNSEPVRDALQVLPGSGGVTVSVESEDGTTGTGSASFGRISGAPDTLASLIINELKPLVVGSDLRYIRRTYQNMLRETEYHGSSGITMFAVSAIDTALWDCLGKSLGVPCWQLWGRINDRIQAYAMVGWLNYDAGQVTEICAGAVQQGFKTVKIKVGYDTLREDVARVELVRGAVGDPVGIMVDANQSLSRAEAIRRGRAFEALGCVWWEEPIAAGDIDGYAELTRALDIPVATGENLYTRQEFARFLKRDAMDVVQVDARRGGGPTSLLQIGAMANAFEKPYASHGGGPVQLNVMACLPNAMYLETGMIREDSPLELDPDGCVNIPEGPGFSWS